MKTLRTGLAATAASLAVVLTGCGGAGGERTKEDGLTVVTVAYTPIYSVGALKLGMDQGFFEKEGLRVELQQVANPPSGIAAVAEKAGLSPLVVNFLKVLARNRRLFAVGDMIRTFLALAARQRGELNAEVASAHPLTDEQLATLKDTLRATAGKDVQLITRVDPTLLGGLIVKMGSRMIDSSLRTKLTSLKTAMKEVR